MDFAAASKQLRANASESVRAVAMKTAFQPVEYLEAAVSAPLLPREYELFLRLRLRRYRRRDRPLSNRL